MSLKVDSDKNTDSRKAKNNPVLDLFKSKVFAIVLIILLGFTAFIGTIIPQEDSFSKDEISNYDEQHSVVRLLDKALSVFQIANQDPWRSSIYAVYHSWWFVIAMTLLAVSLVICSLDRLPSLKSVYRKLKVFPDTDALIKRSAKVYEFKNDKGLITNKTRSWARKHLRVREELSKDNETVFRLQKHRFSRWGYWVVHMGLIVVFIGAVISSFTREKGFVWIMEGETVDHYFSRTTEKSEPLGFELQASDLKVETYEDGKGVKDWFSTLTVMIDGKVYTEKRIEVNDPLNFDGRNFYQSSWSNGYEIIIAVTNNSNGSTELFPVRVGVDFVNVEGQDKTYKHSDGELQFKLENFYPHFSRMSNGTFGTRSGRLINPCAVLQVYWPGIQKIKRKILFSLFPETRLDQLHKQNALKQIEPYTFVLLRDIKPIPVTGIEIGRDAGTGVVYAGFILVLIGVIAGFYFSHRQWWVLLSKKRDFCEVSITGSSFRNKHQFDKETDRLFERLLKYLEQNLR